MKTLFITLAIVFLVLQMNISFTLQNKGKKTTLDFGLGFLKINIDFKKVINKIYKKNKEKDYKEQIQELSKFINKKALFKEILSQCFVSYCNIYRYQSFSTLEYNIYQDTLFYIVSRNISLFLHTHFKKVYSEKYRLIRRDNTSNEYDYAFSFKTNLYLILKACLLYLFKKGIKYERTNSKLIKG